MELGVLDQIVRDAEEIERLKKLNAQLLAACEAVEWSLMRDITNPRYIQCPWCGGFKPHHDPHCRLAAAIKAAKGVG